MTGGKLVGVTQAYTNIMYRPIAFNVYDAGLQVYNVRLAYVMYERVLKNA